MAIEKKRMQQRYGTYDQFQAEKENLLPNEFASVTSGDPNTSDGKGLYFGYGSGNVKRIAFSDEVNNGGGSGGGGTVTVQVASTSTGEAGTDAKVTNSGDSQNVKLNFVIPRGNPGEKGNTGATPNLTIGTVQTLEPDRNATASITGTAENPLLNLGIPKGEKGDPGESQEEIKEWTLLKDITLTEQTAVVSEDLSGQYKSLLVIFADLLSSGNNSIGVSIAFNGNTTGTIATSLSSNQFVQNDTNFKSTGFFEASYLVDGSVRVLSGGFNSIGNRGTGSNGCAYMSKEQMNNVNYFSKVNFSLDRYSTNEMVEGATIKIYGR